MKVIVYETELWERDACQRLSSTQNLHCTGEPLNVESGALDPEAEIVSTFVRSVLDSAVLSRLPKLKLIGTRSAGYDHIDLEYCAKHGIAVSNVPDYGDSTVAEHVFALLLATVRHVVEGSERTRRGDFTQAGLRGFELRDKVLGVLGTGRIGRKVIEIARGFGMHVVAFDFHPNLSEAQRLEYRYASLDETLASSDVLTVHVPGGVGQAPLISDREFGLMRQGSVLVNTARGSVVDIAALVRAIGAGKLRAVGLDVLPQEPVVRDEAEVFRAGSERTFDLKSLVANHVILQFPNVVVTPHIAYNTDEAVRRLIETTMDNIEAFIAGTPRNLVSAAHQSTMTPGGIRP